VFTSFAGAVVTEIRTRIFVGPDHRITGTAPAAVPPGEYEVTLDVVSMPVRQRPAPLNVDALPIHDLGPWPEGLSLRREDIYGEDAR
jgi:hypothetical protein